jgi:hypothetical protein
MTKTLNVLSDGMGQWGYGVVDPLLQITFPSVKIIHEENIAPDLVVMSHFIKEENKSFDCPYIMHSGESYRVKAPPDKPPPLCELNSFDCGDSASIYFPLLALDSKSTRQASLAYEKKYCCAFAFSNPVSERESIFKALKAREATCYAFGSSCATPRPFELTRNNRFLNVFAFKDFGFVVAMENMVKLGYITEKIGMAFETCSVPIYDSRNGIDRFFNIESFFDVSLFQSSEAAAQTIVEVWNDKQKLQKYLDAPIRVNQNLAQYENLYSCNEVRSWMIPFVNNLKEAFPDI